MNPLEIDNFTNLKINGNFFRGLAEIVLAGERKKTTELSISFASQTEIKKLNNKYRKKNRPTDILSFTYKNSGEIVICPAVVKKNAKKFNTSFKKELNRVLIHGVLHVLGYDHERNKKKAEKMEKKTNYYLKLFEKNV